jgi:hypothetical protein
MELFGCTMRFDGSMHAGYGWEIHIQATHIDQGLGQFIGGKIRVARRKSPPIGGQMTGIYS